MTTSPNWNRRGGSADGPNPFGRPALSGDDINRISIYSAATGSPGPENRRAEIQTQACQSFRPEHRRNFPVAENDRLYKPVDPDSPDIRELADSIRKSGLLEPICVDEDGYIASGHRRHAAARLAGLTTIPCRVIPIRRATILTAG